MPMKLGISMFGALQTPDDQLATIIPLSFFSGEISVWRVWCIWYPPGEERSLILPSGALNELMLTRLVNFLNFTSLYNIHVQLVGSPHTIEGGLGNTTGLNRYYTAWSEIMNACSGFNSSVWSTDLWNEHDARDSGDNYRVAGRVYEITREQAPGKKITISQSSKEAGGLSAVERQFLTNRFLRSQQGVTLDYYTHHFERQPPSEWASENQNRFERIRNRIQGGINPGETAPRQTLDLDPEIWDDEGAREGYSPADDPSVNDSVRAAQGAENAGCAVHIFHTGANFFGQIIDPATGLSTLSATELIKLQRIKDEVIDDVSVAPPPGPPEPPPEPC